MKNDTIVYSESALGNGKFDNITFEGRSKVDESILGGFIAQIGDNIFDASIKHDLQTIKKQFIIPLLEKQLQW